MKWTDEGNGIHRARVGHYQLVVFDNDYNYHALAMCGDSTVSDKITTKRVSLHWLKFWCKLKAQRHAKRVCKLLGKV